jgi:hypothetical protein
MSAEVGSQAVIRAQPVTSLPFPFQNPTPKAHKANKDNKKFLWFPCGIVRGALAALGITATVQAETSELPGAVFQIKTVSAKT